MIETIQALFEAIDRENITVLDLPTAYWHEVVEAIDSQALRLPSSVRLVIIGGDRASHKRVASWKKHVSSSVRLLNTYGVTECTSITICTR
jgi:nonribosomal peptide synthetase MxcG